MVKPQDISRVFYGNLLPVAGEYIVDPVHSFAEFKVQHLVVGQIWGRFDSISGSVKIADDPMLSSVQITVDTASISTHNKDRDDDLRSPRYFDVEKYPKMTFVSTGIRMEPQGRFTIDGNLTMRGITRSMSLATKFTGIVEDPWKKTRAAFQAKGGLNRRDFGLMTDLDRETGGLLLGKDVAIRIATEIILK